MVQKNAVFQRALHPFHFGLRKKDNSRGWSRGILATSRLDGRLPEAKRKNYLWLRGQSRNQDAPLERKVGEKVER